MDSTPKFILRKLFTALFPKSYSHKILSHTDSKLSGVCWPATRIERKHTPGPFAGPFICLSLSLLQPGSETARQ